MFLHKFFLLVLCGLLATTLTECCDGFKNVKASIFTGSEFDPLEVILTHGMEEAKEAYRIEIENQEIPILCEDSIKDLKDLDTLVIKHSGIKKIEKGAFKNVPHLRIVDLTYNQIKSVQSGVFNDMKIRRLNMSVNAINKIDSNAFDSMPQLQVVELAGNFITEIDAAWFKNSPKVYRVDLDNNQITEIPKDAFKNMGESKGRDRDLDIWLANNKIKSIHPLAFRNIKKFETLWMSYNEITNIKDITFDDVEKIHSLDLDNNKIQCLSDEVLATLKLDELNIDGNPLDCDCLRKIRKWGQKKNIETQTARRGFSCLRNKIDDVIVAQKKYYEEKIMDHKF